MKPMCPSIITSFGCDRNCWYCITRQLDPKRFRQGTDWRLLELFLSGAWIRKKVSVSGGGDPLYRLDENMEWWERLFEITGRLGMDVDVHTRMIVDNPGFWRRINRCCLSIDVVGDAQDLATLVVPYTKERPRLVQVVTAGTTTWDVLEIMRLCAAGGYQMSLKELAVFDDHGRFEEMRKTFEGTGIFFIEDRDYNVYFMPDNTITETFKNPATVEEITS